MGLGSTRTPMQNCRRRLLGQAQVSAILSPWWHMNGWGIHKIWQKNNEHIVKYLEKCTPGVRVDPRCTDQGYINYCIMMWALESEISKETSEHLRFREPHCHSAAPMYETPANSRTNLIFLENRIIVLHSFSDRWVYLHSNFLWAP